MCEEICWQCKIIATPAPLQNEITIHIIKKIHQKLNVQTITLTCVSVFDYDGIT